MFSGNKSYIIFFLIHEFVENFGVFEIKLRYKYIYFVKNYLGYFTYLLAKRIFLIIKQLVIPLQVIY